MNGTYGSAFPHLPPQLLFSLIPRNDVSQAIVPKKSCGVITDYWYEGISSHSPLTMIMGKTKENNISKKKMESNDKE